MLSFADWKQQPTRMRNILLEANMEEAMLEFFHAGVTPMVKRSGYRWSREDHVLGSKFVRLCYDIVTTLQMGDQYSLVAPHPDHRNLDEDRDTFHRFIDSDAFISLMEEWSCRSEIVGTRLDYKIEEFIYTWINVEAGPPGRWTRELLEANEEAAEDDRLGIHEASWQRTHKENDAY